MKFEFSLLSKHRSFIGFDIGKGGYLSKNENGLPIVMRTLDLTFGFLFGWILFSFNFGGSFELDEINKQLREKALKEK